MGRSEGIATGAGRPRRASVVERSGVLMEILGVLLRLIPHATLMMLRRFGCFRPKPKRVVKKVVLVTGAGQGLGRELAFQFGRLGATVVCVDVNATTVNATRADLRAELVSAHAYACDVANYAQVEVLAERVRRDVGPVCVLINNAGLLNVAEAEGADRVGRIENMTRINLLSHFWMIQSFLPQMIEAGEGHIVAIASGAALFGIGEAITYSACKGGVSAMMDAFADHLRKEEITNIDTTTVYPYFFNTPMVEGSSSLRFPPLPVRDVAEEIVKGIRENQRWFTVPGSMAYVATLMNALPQHLADRLRAIFYTRIETTYNELDPQ